MAGEAQILASAVVETQNLASLRHYSISQYSIAKVPTIPSTGRAGQGAEDAIVQNKPNFRMAQQRLTSGQEKGYVKRYELCVCENKANLAGRACSSVPVRHRRGRPPCLPIPGGQPQGRVPKRDISRLGSRLPLRTGPRAKQSQFPPALANAGWFRHERQPHGRNGCRRNTAAIPAASVGRTWVPKCRRGPERTLALPCGPNPAPNADRTRTDRCARPALTYSELARRGITLIVHGKQRNGKPLRPAAGSAASARFRPTRMTA